MALKAVLSWSPWCIIDAVHNGKGVSLPSSHSASYNPLCVLWLTALSHTPLFFLSLSLSLSLSVCVCLLFLMSGQAVMSWVPSKACSWLSGHRGLDSVPMALQNQW